MGPKEKLVSSPACTVLPLLWEGRIYNHHILIEYREILSIQSKWDFILWYLNPRSLTFPLLVCIGRPTAAVTKSVFVSCNRWSKLPQIEWLNTNLYLIVLEVSSVQPLCLVQLFASPWTAAHQASLSITNSPSLLKLMSIESVMPSNHLILCHFLLLSLSQHQGLFQCIDSSHLMMTGALASPLVLPVNIQGRFPLALTTNWKLLKEEHYEF